MPIPLPSAENRFINRTNSRKQNIAIMPKRTLQPVKKPNRPNRGWLLTLARALQTTLDTEELVRIFSEYTAAIINYDSIHFSAPGSEIEFQKGELGKHSCHYDVVLHGDNLGAVHFTRNHPFSEEETNIFEDLLCNFVHPLHNSLRYEKALRASMQDALTGLRNRASLDHNLAREIQLAGRYSTPLSIIMLDLDRFKAVNDTFGHPVGDQVLQAVAAEISESVRDSDIVFRYGGEEFMVVLSNTGLVGASQLAERIRIAVENGAISIGKYEINATISLGVASLNGDENAHHLIEKADDGLYQSKNCGRNRVTVIKDTHHEPLESPTKHGTSQA